MIEYKELMVDNWVYNSKFKRVQVLAVREWLLDLMTDFGPKDAEPRYCHPIPITPELLKEVGFEFEEEQYFVNKITLIASRDYRDGRYIVAGLDLVPGRVVYVHHFHQLQNVFYIITKEHLTLKF